MVDVCEGMTQTEFDKVVERLVLDDIKRGVQTIQYQISTLMTTNGQAPFISLFVDIEEAEEGQEREDMALIIEEVLVQRIKGVKNEQGVWTAPTFPKILYVTRPSNVYPDSEWYYLTELAAECTNKRMTPDYISAKKMEEYKGDVYPCMGCRAFLSPDIAKENLANAGNWEQGKKYYGRFNQGAVTINLPFVAMMSGGNQDLFWAYLNDTADLCKKALMVRHSRLKGVKSDVAPILWQHGTLARLKKGETIDKLLTKEYSTISLGYAGLYECVKYMTGESHTSKTGREFAISVMKKLNYYTDIWKEETGLGFSLYGTPIESTTYKFAKALKVFEPVKDVNDHDYITNSYHINVREEIDAFTKLKLEAEFQRLSPAGCISYVELPSMGQNIEATIALIQYMYNNIMYAEMNTKIDHCGNCGFDGEMQIVYDDNGRMIWECPQCGCRDEQLVDVMRRTCGYIGKHRWNQGRTAEIRDRVLHL